MQQLMQDYYWVFRQPLLKELRVDIPKPCAETLAEHAQGEILCCVTSVKILDKVNQKRRSEKIWSMRISKMHQA
jgi:hypothetical protein